MKIVGDELLISLLAEDIQTQIRKKLIVPIIQESNWYLQEPRALTRAQDIRYYNITMVCDRFVVEGDYQYISVVIETKYRELVEDTVWRIIYDSCTDIMGCASVSDHIISNLQEREDYLWKYIRKHEDS